MPKEDQAQADLDNDLPGDGTADAATSHDPESGATDLDAYRQEVSRIQEQQGEEPAADESTEETPEDQPEAEGNGEEEEAAGEDGEDDPGQKTPTRFRVRANNEVEAEALALRKRHPDWSFSQCEEKAKAILGVQTETNGTQQAAEDQPRETVESVRARLKELREQKEKLLEDEANAMDDVDFSTASKHRKELTRWGRMSFLRR